MNCNYDYEELVGFIPLINAFEKGINTRGGLLKQLNITEDFFIKALNYYKEKYGSYYEIDHYLIYFEPHLQIIKMLQML